jgi:uncharacterized protein YciI
MKIFLTFTILFLVEICFAQSELPDFLEGTWRIGSQKKYERWDKLNENILKGVSYELKDGRIIISEYLDIARHENEITYRATVLNQNQGKSVDFKLTYHGSTITFENPGHDFPKKIEYKKLSDTEILVHVSDGEQKGFSFTMIKQFLSSEETENTISNPNYDIDLAEKLGADDYGMKGYILVILKTGSNRTSDSAFISNSFRGHLDNINRLVEQNKLIVAGPLSQNDKGYRGIFILNNVKTLEEANELLKTDPAINSGLLDVELFSWYGSAALPLYLENSDKIWKVKP